MRMLHPSPGEIVDRQTILQLKLQAINKQPRAHAPLDLEGKPAGTVRTAVAGKLDPTQFELEHNELQEYLEKFWFPDLKPDVGKNFNALMEDLAEVNQRLWQLEDEARQLRYASMRGNLEGDRPKEILFAINDWNDRRADLVQKINGLWGLQGREKIYA